MFLNYEEYIALGGTMGVDEYPRYEHRAESYINRYTHGRIKDETPVRQNVRLCMRELVDGMKSRDKVQESISSGIASESNDGIGVSYASSESVTKYWDSITKGILCEYLSDETKCGIPLLYGGVEHDTIR